MKRRRQEDIDFIDDSSDEDEYEPPPKRRKHSKKVLPLKRYNEKSEEDNIYEYQHISSNLKVCTIYISNWDNTIIIARIDIYDGLRFFLKSSKLGSFIIETEIKKNNIIWKVRKINTKKYIIISNHLSSLFKMQNIKKDILYNQISTHKRKINKVLSCDKILYKNYQKLCDLT